MTWEPIAHHPVYRRIDLYGPKPEEPRAICSYPYCSCDPKCFAAQPYAVSREEADRIWKLVKQSAEGCNPVLNHRASEGASEANGQEAGEGASAFAAGIDWSRYPDKIGIYEFNPETKTYRVLMERSNERRNTR